MSAFLGWPGDSAKAGDIAEGCEVLAITDGFSRMVSRLKDALIPGG